MMCNRCSGPVVETQLPGVYICADEACRNAYLRERRESAGVALRPPTTPTLPHSRQVDDDHLRDYRRELQRAANLATLALELTVPGLRADTIAQSVETAHAALSRLTGEMEVSQPAAQRASVGP